MAGVKDEPPARRRLRLGKLWWWMVAAIASAIVWQMWKLHLYNAAVREAEAAGFTWKCDDAISLIRQDWHNAFKKETWGIHFRRLDMGEVRDLGRYREMLHRLRPTILSAYGCEKVDGLKGFTCLQWLWLNNCPNLQNVDGGAWFPAFKRWAISTARWRRGGEKRGFQRKGCYPQRKRVGFRHPFMAFMLFVVNF